MSPVISRTRWRRHWVKMPDFAAQVAAPVRALVWALSWGMAGVPLWRGEKYTIVPGPRPMPPPAPPRSTLSTGLK